MNTKNIFCIYCWSWPKEGDKERIRNRLKLESEAREREIAREKFSHRRWAMRINQKWHVHFHAIAPFSHHFFFFPFLRIYWRKNQIWTWTKTTTECELVALGFEKWKEIDFDFGSNFVSHVPSIGTGLIWRKLYEWMLLSLSSPWFIYQQRWTPWKKNWESEILFTCKL